MPATLKLAAIYSVLLFLLSGPSRATTYEPAERARTNETLYRISLAVQSYLDEYGTLPHGDSSTFMAILRGEDRGGQNPRHIVFHEFRQPTKFLFWTTRRGDLDEHGQILDGWGRPFQFANLQDGTPFRMWSLGKDGRSAREDDLLVEFVAKSNPPPPKLPVQQFTTSGNPKYGSSVRTYLGTILLGIIAIGFLILLMAMSGLWALAKPRPKTRP